MSKRTQDYKWVKPDEVIVVTLDGDDKERFIQYCKMVVDMTEAGWEPYGWSFKKEFEG